MTTFGLHIDGEKRRGSQPGEHWSRTYVKHARFLIASLMITACSSGASSPAPDVAEVSTSGSVVTATTTASPPTTTTALPATTVVASTTTETTSTTSVPVGQNCDQCPEITDIDRRGDREISFTLLDRSGRNIVPGTETLNPRPIYVAVRRGADANSQVFITGDYRTGTTPNPALRWAEYPPQPGIEIAVGFPKMDGNNVDFRDIPNHPGDISAVLDALAANPTLIGPVDLRNIHYTGSSMGAISGYLLANTCCHDPRITSAVLGAGFAPDELVGVDSPYNWAEGPKILAINNSLDTVIPYELFQRLQRAVTHNTLTIITVTTSFSDVGHSVQDGSCPEIFPLINNWTRTMISGEPAPVIPTTNCLVSGFVPTGTTGMGAAEFLRR